MKILILPNLTRKMNPRITAARPRLIMDLIDGLSAKGHQVSVLGTGNSKVPSAKKLIPVIEKGFYEISEKFENPFYAHTGFLVKMARMAEKLSSKFDVIHNHGYPEFTNLLVEENLKCPMVTTVHVQITKEMDDTLSLFPKSNIVCISKSSKGLAKKAKVKKVVYNGVDTDLYKFDPNKEDYLLWIGRLSKAKDKKGEFMDPKGVKWAIKLAKETDSRLLISGNVEDPLFFEKHVKPHLNEKIQWIGPVGFEQPLTKREVARLMKKAKVFLMTINWSEPFGLVMAEAQSCGTPVIGFDRGSVSELVKHGKTGFAVDPKKGIKGLKEALKNIENIDPKDCRENVEKNFSLKNMVDNYEKTYKEVIEKWKKRE